MTSAIQYGGAHVYECNIIYIVRTAALEQAFECNVDEVVARWRVHVSVPPHSITISGFAPSWQKKTKKGSNQFNKICG